MSNGISPAKSEKIANYVEHVPAVVKHASETIVLIPQPSDDPEDPLNWKSSTKLLTLLVVSVASFAGTCQALANSSGFFEQAEVYEKTPGEISYSLSSSITGLAVGPLLWAPLAKRIGRSACIFYGMILCIACNIWAACMTAPGDYNSFIVSRLFGGITGSVATTVGAGIIMDIYFLHQRGKAFTFYSIMNLLGTSAAPLFSGFIVTSASWTIQYWYNVALEAFVVLVVFFFLHETGWTRSGSEVFPVMPKNYLKNRLATFFFTQRVVPQKSTSDLLEYAAAPFVIGSRPTGILIGVFILITFGFGVGVNTLLAVFLQEPLKEGGYAFSPTQNALFTFSGWVSIAVAQIYGHFVTDRLPLWLCKRAGGNWKPEYRLHCLWFPAVVGLPIGLGLYGATLQYHLHYMVLATAFFLIQISVFSIVPVVVTYLAECNAGRASEAATILNLYRLAFGVTIPFFIFDWEAKVGAGWAFGMCAFFAIFAFMFVLTLMFKGPALRSTSGEMDINSGEGVMVVEDQHTAKTLTD